MKKLIKIFILQAFLLALPATVFAGCIADLIAGQHHKVGTVTITNDGTVTYQTINGCVLTETHLHVDTSVKKIPQTKNGNPIPGRFMYNDHHNPPKTIVSYQTGKCGDPLYVAAHAVVSCLADTSTSTIKIVSDTSVCIRDDSESCPSSCSQNAVKAWQPYDDNNNTTWDERTGNLLKAAGAEWIWESFRTDDIDTYAPVYGAIVEFEKCFNVPGQPLSGTLNITCDNGYEVKLNNQTVGSAQLVGDWRNSLLTQPCSAPFTSGVARQGWQTIETLDVSGKLYTGQNALHVTGVNEAMMDASTQAYMGLATCNSYAPGPYYPDGEPDPHGLADYPNYLGDEVENPAGCAFTLDITYATDNETIDETAWAAGISFPGKNWATYFTCTVQCQ